MLRVAAIDLGASSGRVLTGEYAAGELTITPVNRFTNGPVFVPRSGGTDLVWDILSLWNGIRCGLLEASHAGPLDSVGIDTWGVDYGLLDSDGRIISNPASYRSDRTSPAVAHLHKSIAPTALYAANGIQFQPFNTLYQLLADQSESYSARATTVLLLPDLITYWLTGQQICEVTNASTTGLLDPRTRTWNPTILELLQNQGVRVPQILTHLTEPGVAVGPISVPECDIRTAQGTPTPLITVGSHDTASAVVAVPAPGAVAARRSSGASFGFISSGTWSLVGIELDAPVLSEKSRQANFTNELGVDGTVRYLKNIMGMWVQQELLRELRECGEAEVSWEVLDRETEAAPAFRSMFDINDPPFAAPGAMRERIDSACVSAGFPVPRCRGEYLRAITESLVIAYRRALREATDLSGTSIQTVHIVGGGSKNRLLCQLTADAVDLPVVAGPVEGTAMGNMVVQLRALGAVSGTLDDLRAIIACSVTTTTYEPHTRTSTWDEVEAALFNRA